MWGVRVNVQVSRRKLYTHMQLDYVIVEFLYFIIYLYIYIYILLEFYLFFAKKDLSFIDLLFGPWF